MQNNLIHKGARVITASDEDIHVSGHPARDELRQMYEWVRPTVLIPVHGDARHLDEHARFGLECGIETVVVPENGSLIQINKEDTCEIDLLPSGRWVFDGKRMIGMNSQILKDRQKLSTEGLIVATLVIDENGILMQSPQLTIKGLCDTDAEHDELSSEIYLALTDSLESAYGSPEQRIEKLQAIIRKAAHRCLDKKPVVDVHLIVGAR